MAQFKSHAQYQHNFLWSLVTPVVAMLVAVPLSVALVTHIVHAELSNDLVALKTQSAAMAPVAATTASTQQTACAGTAQATQATSTTPAVVQTASVNMPAQSWANPMGSAYVKSYTKVSNSYTNTSTKTYIVDSYNNNSHTKNVNSGNTTSTTVNSTTTNTASGGSVINSSSSANTTAVNGDKNHAGVYNNQSSSASNTTTNNTIDSYNAIDSNNTVNSNNKTKVDVDVDSHDKTININPQDNNCNQDEWCESPQVV